MRRKAASLWVLIAITWCSAVPVRAMETESEQARRERVEKMSIEEKEELRQKQERFVSLTEQEQQRIRQLHEDLTTREDADKLRGVLERYHAWLTTLSSAERAELLSLPTDQRIERIKKMMQKQEDERFKKEVSDKLTGEDREAIMKWLLAFVDAHRQEVLDALPADRRPPEAGWPLMFTMLRGWGSGDLKMPRPNPEDVQELINSLSPSAQETIKNVREPQKRMEVAQRWIRAAFESRRWRAPPPVSREELRKFYAEKLSASERERLEALTPEEMQNALQRAYYEQQFRGRGGFGPGGPSGPGRGEYDGPSRGGRGPGDFKKKGGPPPEPPAPPLD